MIQSLANPGGQSPEAQYGMYFFEGDILRSARGGNWNFYKDPLTKESLYYFTTTETDNYMGRCTGVLKLGNGGFYLEVQRPKAGFGFVPGTLLPAFSVQTGYIYIGPDIEYLYNNMSIDGRQTPYQTRVVSTIATPGENGGTVEIVKTSVEPEPSNVPAPQSKTPMYVLYGVLALAAIAIGYLAFRKPKTKKS